MVNPQSQPSGWLDWLQLDPSPALAEDLLLSSLAALQLNGRFLYLQWTPALTDLSAGTRRVLEALARQGDTVFVAVGQHPGQIQLSYRMPDLENAVAFDAGGLKGLIQQWFSWATSAPS